MTRVIAPGLWSAGWGPVNNTALLNLDDRVADLEAAGRALWIPGHGAPASGLGTTGDWYVDVDSGSLYFKTDAVTWVFKMSVEGTPGATGPQGLPGVASAAFQPTHAYTVGSVVQHTDGSWLACITNHTSGASIDLTKFAVVSATVTTVEGSAVAAAAMGRAALPSHVVTRARSNPFDARVNAYNYKPSNTKRTRAGLGRAAVGGVSEWLIVGDSFSAGAIFGATTPFVFDRPHTWPRMMAKALGVEDGTGWVRVNDDALGSPYNWTFTGSWNMAAKFYALGTSTSTATFTVPDGMTGGAVSIMWFDFAAGGGTYPWIASVDGATSGNGYRVTTSELATAGWRVTTLTPDAGLKSGSTVVITAGANSMVLAGIKIWSPADGGLQVHNLAQSGSRAYSTTTGETDKWASTGTNGLGTLLATGTNGTTAWSKRTITDGVLTAGSNVFDSATANFTLDDIGKSIYTPADLVSLKLPPGNVYIQQWVSSTRVLLNTNALAAGTGLTVDIGQVPDCVFIELGGNDLSNSVSSANIIAAITAIRNMLPNTDVVLMVIPQPDNSLIANATYDAWVSDMYDLADTLDCPLVDLRARYGTHADLTNNRLLGDSAAHTQTAVFADVGASVAAMFGGPYGNRNSPVTGVPVPWQSIASGANVTLDGRKPRARLIWLGATGASTITLSNPTDKNELDIQLGSGANPPTLSWAGTAVKWKGGLNPPQLYANSVTTVKLRYDAGASLYAEVGREEGVSSLVSPPAANQLARAPRLVAATTGTAAGTAAKVVTTSPTGYVLTPGDKLAVVFQFGNTAANPTLAVNGGTAYPIYQSAYNVAPQNMLAGTNGVIEVTFTGSAFIMTYDVTPSVPAGSLGTISGTLDLSGYTAGSTNLSATLNGNITGVTLPTLPAGASATYVLEFIQDGTGSRTFTISGVNYASGVAPVLSTAAGARDLITLLWTGQAWWLIQALGVTVFRSGTTATAVSTAAKTATITGYTPAVGDTVSLVMTFGNTAASPTLAINGGTAYGIYLGGVALTLESGVAVANGIWFLRFNGARWDAVAPSANYSSITTAQAQAGSSTTIGWWAPSTVKAAVANRQLNTQSGTTYTTVASDVGKRLSFTNTSPITLTIAAIGAAGDKIEVQQYGSTGQITFAGSGVTLRIRGGLTKTSGQYAKVEIYFISSSEVLISGDLA